MKLYGTLLIALLAVSALPTAAHAQTRDSDAGNTALGLLLLGASTGSGVLSGYSTWGKSSSAHALNDRYFKEHSIALQQDLVLGAGDTIDDLATATGVAPDRIQQFGVVLRKNRAELLAIAGRAEETPQGAQELLLYVDHLASIHGLKAIRS